MIEVDRVDVDGRDVEGEVLVYERLLRNDLDRCHDLNGRDLVLWRESGLFDVVGGIMLGETVMLLLPRLLDYCGIIVVQYRNQGYQDHSYPVLSQYSRIDVLPV